MSFKINSLNSALFEFPLNSSPPLCELIESGASTETIQYAIEATPILMLAEFLNQPNEQGLTPLMIVAGRGDRDLVQLLLEMGAEIKGQDQDGNTALHHAAIQGNAGSIGLLLDHGAAIEVANNQHESALYLAANNGQSLATATLLAKGAGIEKQKLNFLDSAIEKGHTEIVRILLKERPHCLDLDWALLMAVRCGNMKIVELLIDAGADANAVGSPLARALRNGLVAIARFLLKKGANPPIGKDCLKHIEIAAKQGYLQIIDILLEAKAHDEVFKAVMRAIKHGKAEVVDWALKKGIKKHEMGVAIGLVAKKGNANAMKALLNAGMEVDTVCGQKAYTALHIAAEYGHVGLVDLLLSKGANIDAKTKDGKRALFLAAQNLHADVVQTLIKNKAQIDANNTELNRTALSHVIYYCLFADYGLIEVIKYPFKDKKNYSFLNKLDCLNIAKILLKNGANILNSIEDIDKNKGNIKYKFCCTRPESISFVMEYLPKQLHSQLDQLDCIEMSVKEGKEALLQLQLQLTAFHTKLEHTILPCLYRIISKEHHHNSIPPFSPHPFYQRILKLQTQCQNQLTKIEQETKGFKEAEKEFDNDDVFALLAAWGAGFGQKIEIKEKNGEKHSVALLPKESYEFLFHCKHGDFWPCGLETGSDLRTLGIDRTISNLLEYKMKKDPERASQELLSAIGEKIQLFEMLQRLEYQNRYEGEDGQLHDRIEEILAHLKTISQGPLNELTLAVWAKWETTMGQVLLRAYFSQGVDTIKAKLGPLQIKLSELKEIKAYSTEDLFSFRQMDKKRKSR